MRDWFAIAALIASGCTSAAPEPPPSANGSGGSAAVAVGSGGAAAVAANANTGGQPASVPDPPPGAHDAGVSSNPTHVDAAVHAADAQVDAGPPPQVCAATSSLKPGDSSAMLEHGGLARRYLVHVPSNIKPTVPAPLVLDFHGNGSSAAQEAGGSGWIEKGDAEGFIVVHPDGVGGGWNVGNCCGEALSSNVDDVGFAKAIVTAISDAACIDQKRIYATGISNGAGLSHRLACEAADVFAAIAAASADLVTDPCTPARPTSELSVRGLSDTLVAYAGGNTGSTGWYSPGAKGTLDLWKAIDQCTGTVDTSKQYCETYASCANNVEITLCSLPNTGHILYNNALGFSVPDAAWEMFKRQPMP